MEQKTILLVEDDADLAECEMLYLRREGYRVICANDGEIGLNEAIEYCPDLIILDLNLPSLPGEEVCKAIREHDNEEIASIPIIMVTGKASEVDRIVGRVVGANDYMVKPADHKELSQKIKGLLDKSLSV
ncbi:MAG: hypothetical protein A3G33_01550 [Omnitrophica bacterium RIFCSPLOWO2_12_FULL_44_17]|uniref:Response regulatory domain-containing protein n=1 Tax=Candidatus Danuiimicrobium aquiferis TaxID=1801832 RepID=A0A1G1KW51_9BACT|nr:MAG: hypothetical protein A3B72_00780 [Omnitrophica bacterium RIFCSPHIGHO2_02_FULL_45_28]OGW96799.1 MAG: hypothetical protein A3G33_01550 [Omnitrophica bacterium RIFCSPLOWO2_12_FULL_44_17]OGX03800.1 MAG: hypothetical protein A3J12_09435 [Omnitrophica bacterium RIFCSPLOWO2_02_FULL_44_11]